MPHEHLATPALGPSMHGIAIPGEDFDILLILEGNEYVVYIIE